MTVAEREPGLKNRGHLSSITANAPITNPYPVIPSEVASSLAKKRGVEGPLVPYDLEKNEEGQGCFDSI
jgi:hypothetical protein